MTTMVEGFRQLYNMIRPHETLAVSGELAPELLDLDGAVVALDNAVGLRRPSAGAE